MSNITNWILNRIGINKVWDWILNQSLYEEGLTISSQTLQEAFNKVPDLANCYKARKIALLKSVMIEEKNSERLKGHIEEIEFILRFDIPTQGYMPKVEEVKVVVPTRKEFLDKWKPKEDVSKKDTSEKKK